MGRHAWCLAVVGVLAATILLPRTGRTQADEEPNLEFAYTVVTKRAVLERELELKVDFAKSRDQREAELSAAIEWLILPRWQVELEVPFVLLDPADAPTRGGVGDIELTNRILLYKSLEYRTLVTFGLEVKFPTGSTRRDLGGEFTIEPFLAAGIALGPFDLQASVAYEVGLKKPYEQQLEVAAAIAYPWSRWFTPVLEVQILDLVRGESGDPILNRGRVTIVPGFNVKPLPGMTIRAGVEIPVTDAKDFDYAVHTGVAWEF